MKGWDHAVSAVGIDLGVWMDAQADPEVVSTDAESVTVEFRCWDTSGTDGAPPRVASYMGRLRFHEAHAYRVVDGELGPYRLIREGAVPECLFEVRLAEFDMSKRLEREASWLPSVREARDPGQWFARLDAWDPEHERPPDLSGCHLVVDGRNSYVEVLAVRYQFEQVAVESS